MGAVREGNYDGVFPAKTVISDYAVSNLDIAPTILQAFGVEASIDQDGVSWFDTARGLANTALEARQCIVSEIDLQRSVMCGDHKLISNLEADTTKNYAASADVVQLYDLAKDPTEQSNVAADTAYAGVLARLQEYLACHDKDTANADQPTPCDVGLLDPLLLRDGELTAADTTVAVATTEASPNAAPLYKPPVCKMTTNGIGKAFIGPIVIQPTKVIGDLTDRASTAFHTACMELCRADLRCTYWQVHPCLEVTPVHVPFCACMQALN